jgi:hypothetical protein
MNETCGKNKLKSNCGVTPKVEKVNSKQHWEDVYSKTDHNKMGWFEENPQASLDLIAKCNLNTDSVILNVGAGATTLVDKLIDLNYQNILATDISQNALSVLLGRVKSHKDVRTIVDDLTHPTKLKEMPPVDLWHDRAVLHFFIEDKDQNTYFELLKSKINPNGHVILATFNFDGATKCSGLPIKQYDAPTLTHKMGPTFELIHNFNYTYTMPSGDTREYVYTLFKKK